VIIQVETDVEQHPSHLCSKATLAANTLDEIVAICEALGFGILDLGELGGGHPTREKV
jgi:ssDNA-specific exonuclease RecJ